MDVAIDPPTTEGRAVCDPRKVVAGHVAGLRGVVADLDPDAVVPQAAPDLWSLFDQVERLAAAGKVLVGRRVVESSVWRDAGRRSAAEYLALRSGSTNPAVANALVTSRHIKDLPTVQAALRRGALSVTQANAIAGAAHADPRAQERLLEMAKTASIKELRDECLRVKAAADPDPEAKRRRQYKERSFRDYTDAEGTWCFSGRGTPENAGVFRATLNPIINEIFNHARKAGRHEEHAAYFDYNYDIEDGLDRFVPDNPGTAAGSAPGAGGRSEDPRDLDPDDRADGGRGDPDDVDALGYLVDGHDELDELWSLGYLDDYDEWDTDDPPFHAPENGERAGARPTQAEGGLAAQRTRRGNEPAGG